jgi:hypothetical protein
MKKLIVTLALAASVVSSFAVSTSARAAELEPLQIQPQLVQPELGELKIKPAPVLTPEILILKRAELTSQLFVIYGYNQYFNPNPNPNYPAIVCLVKNTGSANSGWFKTLIRIHRYGYSTPISAYVWTNVPAGGYAWIYGHVYAPYGLKQVFSYADVTSVVPEYIETNNWDTIP